MADFIDLWLQPDRRQENPIPETVIEAQDVRPGDNVRSPAGLAGHYRTVTAVALARYRATNILVTRLTFTTGSMWEGPLDFPLVKQNR